jgi:hypothetical protein
MTWGAIGTVVATVLVLLALGIARFAGFSRKDGE